MLGTWCSKGADGGPENGRLRWLLSRGFRREGQEWTLVSRSIRSLVFRERLVRKEVALGEEVGSGSGGETQERAGAE